MCTAHYIGICIGQCTDCRNWQSHAPLLVQTYDAELVFSHWFKVL